MSTAPLLEVRDLDAGYGGLQVLHGVSAAIRAATITAVIGPNGAGKSTFLRALAGLVGWRRGTIRFTGEEMGGASPEAILARGISFVPQGRCNFPLMTVRAGNMSGGEQQILEMAMALMLRPTLLLLDEPSLGLAPGAMRHVFAEVQRLAREGTTVVMVEQNARSALEIADHALVLELGRLRMAGGGAEALANPEVRRLYLGARRAEARP
jgi:branched-chain amino acid transport system ATP-binding protein